MKTPRPPETYKYNSLGIDFSPDGLLLVRIFGDWRIGKDLPSMEEIIRSIPSGSRVQDIGFDTTGLKTWDSGLLSFLLKIKEFAFEHDVRLETEGLPEGVRRLLRMASKIPEREGAGKKKLQNGFFSRIGEEGLVLISSAKEMLAFIGEAFVAFVRLIQGKTSFRLSDLGLFIQECGSQAFAIVSLISLLVGVILAFVGAVQLKAFGAQIYVADLVGISMVRVMGAIMTGIIMAGRTGAAFAAQLGTMQINEEIDALKTLGISAMEFLVLPRMLALTLMMPLLCLYADLMGVLGGMIVGVVMLDISPIVYLNQTAKALSLTHLWIGVFHSTVFGVLIALLSCLRGMQCGRSASAVGDATTSAVVTGIVSIIVATAIITVLCDTLGI